MGEHAKAIGEAEIASIDCMDKKYKIVNFNLNKISLPFIPDGKHFLDLTL